MLSALILNSDIKVIDAGRQANAMGQSLYITERGQVVISPNGQPGWTKIAVKIKSPTYASLEIV